MNSPEWVSAGGGHKAPALALEKPAFLAVCLAFDGRNQTALDEGEEFSASLPRQVFLNVGRKAYTDRFLASFGPALLASVREFDACAEPAGFQDYLFLESLKRFLQLYDLISCEDVQKTSELLRERLAKTQAIYRAELVEATLAKAEEKARLIEAENLRLRQRAAALVDERLLEVTGYDSLQEAPSGAIRLTSEDRELVRSLQKRSSDAVVNWTGLSESSGYSVKQLKSLGNSSVNSRTRAVTFRTPAGSTGYASSPVREQSPEYATAPESPSSNQ